MSSGSSTAGSHAHSSDMQESAFLKRSRAIHLGRLCLSSLILVGAVAVIACEAVPFQHYKSTAQWANSGLALWPLNFDLRPTVAALSCGCVIAVLNLIYVVVALLPSVSLLSLYFGGRPDILTHICSLTRVFRSSIHVHLLRPSPVLSLP